MSSTAFLNPCFCGSSVTPTPTTTGCGDTCLCICHVIVLPEDYVTPCDLGSIDLSTYVDTHNFTVCDENPITWSLVDFDVAYFEVIEITPTGTITWTPKIGGPTTGNAEFKVTCGLFSEIKTFSVGTLNVCIGTVCPSEESCNPCTGVCEPDEVDFQVVIN